MELKCYEVIFRGEKREREERKQGREEKLKRKGTSEWRKEERT